MTRLALIFSALAVIARTRVPVLPGWDVPALALLTVALLALAVIVVTLTVTARRPRWTPAPAAEAAPETEGTAQ